MASVIIPPQAAAMRRSRVRLVLLVALILAFKLWLPARFFLSSAPAAAPPPGGADPALGFYAHPRMIGWVLAPLLRLSWPDWSLPLPVFHLPLGVAAGIHA